LHCANFAFWQNVIENGRLTGKSKYNSFPQEGGRVLATSQSSPVCARFDRFEVDLVSGDLRTDEGASTRIQPLPLQVLRLLLEAQGGVITRKQLRSTLWPEETFVDFEHGVNTAVKKLRQALGDSTATPKFIETLPKIGYRFLVAVEWVARTDEKQHTRAASQELASAAYSKHVTRSVFLGTVLAAAIAACAVAAYLLYRSSSFRAKSPQPSISFPVTSVGEKYSPSLSPDGKQLAYAWNGGAGPNFSIYVKPVGTEGSLRLTSQRDAIDFNPVWSPDGGYIAFCRIKKGNTGIYIVPALGGPERKLRDTHWEQRDIEQYFWYFGRLSWSLDGRLLAFSDRPSSNAPSSIYFLSLDSLGVRKLTSAGWPGDYNPAFSPDGQSLAFNRGSQGVTSIYTLPVAGGDERLLISGSQLGWGLAWTPDSREIVFGRAGWLARSAGLWKISAHGGEPERLQFAEEGTEPSIRGNRLGYARQQMNLTIRRMRLQGVHPSLPSEQFLSSTAIESGPQYSPDGSMIVFESTRSGSYEVWSCRSDGSNPLQLTHFNTVTGTPRWSPDGEQIAFDSRASGNADVFVMDSRGGSLRKQTNDRSAEVVPSWSHDGRWIYFASDRSGAWEVWKMPSAGGPAVRVTHHGGYRAFESPDGQFVYFTKYPAEPGIWRIPRSGGEESVVIPSLEPGYWGYWEVVDDGIFYLDTIAKPAIAFYDFARRRTARVFDLERRPAREIPGLAVSPDSRSILYTQLDALSRDVVLVENFR